jgi:type IV pilus assembly protein PilE
MRRRGFTMVEVLVAGVVGVILATMAWPAYRTQLQRAGRTEAIEALQRLQLAQERHRETFGRYATDMAAVGIPTLSAGGRYRLELTPTGVEAYRVLAVAQEGQSQAGDGACQALSIEVRQGFATLGPDGRCWNR